MNSNAVYILPYYFSHAEELSSNLAGFSRDDISFLFETLYLNVLENLNSKQDKIDIFCIWDKNRKDSLPDVLKSNNYNIVFSDTSKKKDVFERISAKEFLSYKNNLIIFSDAIDIKPSDYEQYLNLLNIEDESLVIAKNKENIIAVFGFNNYSEEIIKNLLLSNFSYNDFLGRVKSCEHFMHIVNDVLLVRGINDFKQLYQELSHKKSIEYCSQEMHERFTHLFVEYKDLLK
jgi:hypothetical protein